MRLALRDARGGFLCLVGHLDAVGREKCSVLGLGCLQCELRSSPSSLPVTLCNRLVVLVAYKGAWAGRGSDDTNRICEVEVTMRLTSALFGG